MGVVGVIFVHGAGLQEAGLVIRSPSIVGAPLGGVALGLTPAPGSN